MIVVKGIHRLGESPFLEVEMPTMGSHSLMKRGALHRPSSRLIVKCSVGVVYTVHGLLPFPSPGHLQNPGIEPRSPPLQADSLPAEPPGKPKNTGVGSLSLLQQISHIQESNQSLLHCRRILYQLRYQGLPKELPAIPFSIVGAPIYIPISSVEGFPFLHPFSKVYHL